MSKKVLIIGDLHCGSMCGLTHPDWFVSKGRNQFYANLQREMWDDYLEMCNDFGKVDVLIVNGDVIDGKGGRSGSTELVTADMFEQCDMAVKALEQIDAGTTLDRQEEQGVVPRHEREGCDYMVLWRDFRKGKGKTIPY